MKDIYYIEVTICDHYEGAAKDITLLFWKILQV